MKATCLFYYPLSSSRAYYMVDGQRVGGKSDVAAYGPDSYAHAGVPEGKLSEKMVHTSKIYEGMKSDYWIYVPAQYDPGKAAALMVWQDGQGRTQRDGATADRLRQSVASEENPGDDPRVHFTRPDRDEAHAEHRIR